MFFLSEFLQDLVIKEELDFLYFSKESSPVFIVFRLFWFFLIKEF